MRWAEPWAYGELALRPWEFWRLTVRECLLMLDGVFRRQDREWQQIAALGMWILAPYQKKDHVPMTAEKLLGRRLQLFPEVPHDGDGESDDAARGI